MALSIAPPAKRKEKEWQCKTISTKPQSRLLSHPRTRTRRLLSCVGIVLAWPNIDIHQRITGFTARLYWLLKSSFPGAYVIHYCTAQVQKIARRCGKQNNRNWTKQEIIAREEETKFNRLRALPLIWICQTSTYVDELLALLLDHYWPLRSTDFYSYMRLSSSAARPANPKEGIKEEQNNQRQLAATSRSFHKVWDFES